MRARVLLADNSPDYRRSLRAFLELEGYQVEEATSVQEAKEKLAAASVDLALVDLRLTDEESYDISGLEVARWAGERGVSCIIITAYPSVEATRQALRSRGAEPLAVDFVPKGSGPQTILDAIEAVLNRRQDTKSPSGDLVLDPERGLVWRKGMTLDLSRQQYALLALLYRKQGAVCNAQEILKEVYREELIPEQASADKRLERLVARLREKIEDDPTRPRHLLTVPGRGFRLVTGD